ncbi:MAG: molybdopterin-dependent oxidoreductase [Hyphomicrobiaceae bacterium]
MMDARTKLTPFSTHWGTYLAEVESGRLVGVRDFAGDPDPAVIGPGIVEAVYHPARIAGPVVRKGFLEEGHACDRSTRGAEPFVAVSWEEATELAAAELDRVRKAHGNRAIFGGSYGWASAGRFHHAQSQLHRFLNCIGGYTASIDTYSHAAAHAIMPHIVGDFHDLICNQATAWPVISEHTRLLVMLGGLPRKNAQVNASGVGRHIMAEALRAAKQNGCDFVSVSPLRSDAMPELGAEWLAARPGSDTALMLGLAHTLVAEDLHDRQFLTRYTTGYDRFEPYLMGVLDGQPKDADWAARLTGLEAGTIRGLARRMAHTRTMITLTWSLQRADHGEQPLWMAVTLAAMLGQIGLPGGGFGIGYSSANGVGYPVTPMRWPSLAQWINPVEDAIPVARISDLLLNPGGTYDFDGGAHVYPDIRLVYWAGGNPFHHHQDINRLVAALRRPETIIVNEIWWTPMARHADIVFPATTMLERDDLSMCRWDPLLVAMQQAIPPVGGARHDYDVLTGIARALGIEEAFTEGRTGEEWLERMWTSAQTRAEQAGFSLPELAAFREQGMADRPSPARPSILLENFRADPIAHPLTTPSGRIEIFSERIAGFGYQACSGHPRWMPPYEWLGAEAANRFPLHLISNQPRTRLHSQLDCGSVSQASKVAGREPITIHPDDAARRRLQPGDVVRVFNDRGACLAGVIISDDVMRGVVQLATGAWYDPETPGEIGSLCKHGNPNVLTRDKGTSELGQGPTAHSCLVEVEKFAGTPPPVTAFDPPEIEER